MATANLFLPGGPHIWSVHRSHIVAISRRTSKWNVYNRIVMIRKVIIVMLTLAAFSTAVLWILRLPDALDRTTWRSRWIPVDLGKGRRLDFTIEGVQLTVSYTKANKARVIVAEEYWHIGPFGCSKGLWLWPPWSKIQAYPWVKRAPTPFSRFAWRITFPLSALIVLFAAYPIVTFIRGPMRRWHRRREGLCQTCGYNLTGNVSGVCPECGTRIAHLADSPDHADNGP